MKASDRNEMTAATDFWEEYRWLMDDPALKGRLQAFADSLSHGLDDLITDLLTELRSVTSADAASIYVADRGVLRFVYVQNDTLTAEDGMTNENGKNFYLGNMLPVDDNSICGYVAKTKKPLLIGDVQKLPPTMPFRFNDLYDRNAGYTTVSALTSPILDDAGNLAGVLQLLNHKEKEGEICPFEDWMLGYVLLLVENLLPMIARCFDRYRERRASWERGELSATALVPDMYGTVRAQLSAAAINKSLPWLVGSGVSWTKRDRTKESNISKRLLAYSQYVNQFEDINTIIEMMLTEARDATQADGGTFYLVEGGDRLRFAYVQNDTLFTDNTQHNHYVNNEIPVNSSSISGYVALEKKLLNIPDVSRLRSDVPYSFNRSFDEASGYHTVSILTVPVLGSGNTVLAVLQLINSKDADGSVKAFDEADARYAVLLAGQTMPYLMRTIMTRRLINSMLKISNLQDPHETGAHVHRVGSFAAELYHQWAGNREIDPETLRIEKDTIRLAAMLHDIGKVAVPDAVLKKPGKLDDAEYAIMKTHCAQGASMYADADSRLERMAYEITLHHHQRWDGKGYTGDPGIPALAGEEIPIYARITSVADVLDALVSPRSYKAAWTFEEAMAELNRNAATQFDPDMVAAANEISDILEAIIARYQ